MYERHSTATVGEHRGRPRIYLQGRWLLRADFCPGVTLTADVSDGQVVLRTSDTGERVVSSKRDVPVIDVNASWLRDAFGTAETVHIRARSGEIVITKARTEALRAARTRNGLEGSIFSGGGFLTEAARQAGFTPAFAVEWDERYAEVYEKNHPTARVFNMSVHEVPTNELPQVELLTMGIPCEAFSKKRRDGSVYIPRNSKDAPKQRGIYTGNLPPEAHELGDMVVWALRVVEACNPVTVVVEEVPQFLNSGAGWILLHALRRLGYHVEHRVLDPVQHGHLTGRKRAVIVATDRDVRWPAERTAATDLGALLDSNGDWWTEADKPWVFNHWRKQTAKGNGFAAQQLTAGTQRVQAITKRYFAGQGDAPVVAHPTRPGTYRWLTVDEVKRLHGVPAAYWLPEAKTVAGEVLGQAVVVPLFAEVIRLNTAA